MHASIHAAGRTIVPTLRYRDVSAAIDWLCNAFGFQAHQVVRGDDGSVRYAELTFGDGMIMLGPVEDSAFDKFMTQPEQTGGAETQICYLFVADAAAHCAKAGAAGAEIVLDIEDEASAGRGYSCRDLEGHIWNFGTYNPWKRQPVSKPAQKGIVRRTGDAVKRLVLMVGFVALAAVGAAIVAWGLGIADLESVAAGWPFEPDIRSERREQDAESGPQGGPDLGLKQAREQLAKVRAAKESAERLARSASEQFAQERSSREAAERAVKEAQAQLAQERAAKDAIERAMREVREQLARAEKDRASPEVRDEAARSQAAIASAERIARETREQLSLVESAAEAARQQLAAEREARDSAERAARESKEQLAKERATREAAERASKEAKEQLARERSANRAPPQRRRQVEQPSSPFFWQ